MFVCLWSNVSLLLVFQVSRAKFIHKIEPKYKFPSISNSSFYFWSENDDKDPDVSFVPLPRVTSALDLVDPSLPRPTCICSSQYSFHQICPSLIYKLLKVHSHSVAKSLDAPQKNFHSQDGQLQGNKPFDLQWCSEKTNHYFMCCRSNETTLKPSNQACYTD